MSEALLHYDVHGSDGPCVLFVHGLLSSRSHWLPNLPAFTPSYRPVVVELLGHGRSPAPQDAACYEPSRYVRQFELIRQALGVERWYVVGQSLGAALTLRYALDVPDRIIAQVFTNSNSALADRDFAARVRPLMEQQAEAIEREGRAVLDRHRFNPARARRVEAGVKEALERDFALHDPRGIAMTGLHTIPHSSVRERLNALRVPTLLTVGERDKRFAPLRQVAEAAIDGLQVCGIDAGHAVNLQAPDAFNTAVLAFFAAQRDQRTGRRPA